MTKGVRRRNNNKKKKKNYVRSDSENRGKKKIEEFKLIFFLNIITVTVQHSTEKKKIIYSLATDE